ncbi:MAG: four helix bundle protein [Pirellulaceae bacterium]|nr:four helix bundle protein [Fuerstiella sp.]HIK95992.1 four helix bundle protein [Planctomycetota bacterium]
MGDAEKATEIEDRLIGFAVRVIKVADALPKSSVGKHIAGQLLRSGNSPAPNYAEARGAESNADFVHKLKIALKELNESCVWLKMICRAELMKTELLNDLIDENQQLCRILNASVKTPNNGSEQYLAPILPMTND